MKLGMLAIAALAALAVWWLSSRNTTAVQLLSAGGRGPIPMDPNVGAPAAAASAPQTSGGPPQRVIGVFYQRGAQPPPGSPVVVGRPIHHL